MTAIADGRDYLTVYPCASGRPDTSNLNTRPGIPTPNVVVAIPDVNREICIFSHGTVASDRRPRRLVVGWSRSVRLDPAATRVYDTRQPGGARLARFVVREVKIPPSVIPDGSTAAVVNLTVDRAAAAGYLTAFPCGQPAPPSSNLNFVAGEARAVAAIVGLGLGSTMCVMSDIAADVIVDVNGYYAPAPQFRTDRRTAAHSAAHASSTPATASADHSHRSRPARRARSIRSRSCRAVPRRRR